MDVSYVHLCHSQKVHKGLVRFSIMQIFANATRLSFTNTVKVATSTINQNIKGTSCSLSIYQTTSGGSWNMVGRISVLPSIAKTCRPYKPSVQTFL